MICPKCKEEGHKSQVTRQVGFATLMSCPAFYDEDGIFHHHDLNRYASRYSCSRGHIFEVSNYKKCPNCDFVAGEEQVTVR